MKVIGITGGTGCGKSTVSDILRQQKYRVLNLDTIGHNLLEPGNLAYDEVLAVWPSIKNADGTINRKMLGGIVFSDESSRVKLDSIMIPKIKEKLLDRLKTIENEDLVFVDGALIVEKGLCESFSELIVVICSVDTQICRIKARDNLTTDEVIGRINSQLPQEEKLKYATAIIYNDSTLEHLKQQVNNVLKGISQ